MPTPGQVLLFATLFGPLREAEPGEFGRCMCGRATKPGEGMWGPPMLEVFELGDLVVEVDAERTWHCRRCAARAWAEYSRKLAQVQQYELDLGLKRARHHVEGQVERRAERRRA